MKTFAEINSDLNSGDERISKAIYEINNMDFERWQEWNAYREIHRNSPNEVAV